MRKYKRSIIVVSILLIIGSVWLGIKGINIVDKKTYEEVPFTSYYDGVNKYVLLADIEHKGFILQGEDQDIECPIGYLPLKIIMIREETYVFAKKLFDRSTCLFKYSEGGVEEVNIPNKFQEFIFRDALYFEDRLEHALFFVVYNTEISSNQLFKFDVLENGGLIFSDSFSVDLNFGDNNVDENVRMIISDSTEDFNGNKGLFIMGTQYYYVYQTWVPFTLNRYQYDYEARLLETYDVGNDKYYLTHSETESMMFLYNINNRAERKEIVLNEKVFTGTIEVEDTVARIKEVTEPEEYIELLEKDITSLQCGGVIEMGSNNLEGRIPWSQTYYLNGFLDFLLLDFSDNMRSELFDEFQLKIEKRLKIELRLLEELIDSEKELTSKRYHLNREEHLSGLHYARVMQVFNRYNYYVGEDVKVYSKLYERAVKYIGTVEKVKVAEMDDINGVKEGDQYLITGQGTLFNECAAPYNYMSAYVENVFQDALLVNKVEIEYKERAKDFISILLEDEHFIDFDSEYDWSYFYGETYNGWEMDESKTVPYFEGQTYMADISYRSMDAMAIIYAFRMEPGLYNEEILDYLRTGVETGKLFPFVNEAFMECGYPEARISINMEKKWLRVHHSWNIQNTVWAYYSLLSEFKDEAKQK